MVFAKFLHFYCMVLLHGTSSSVVQMTKHVREYVQITTVIKYRGYLLEKLQTSSINWKGYVSWVVMVGNVPALSLEPVMSQ